MAHQLREAAEVVGVEGEEGGEVGRAEVEEAVMRRLDQHER